MEGNWIHNFPVSKDGHPTYIQWPNEGWDLILVNVIHEIFTALDALQDALGYDIRGGYATCKAWLDVIAAGAAADIFLNFVDLISWGSLDGFNTVTDGTGTIEARGSLVYLKTGTVVDNDVSVRTLHRYPKIIVAGKKTTVEWPCLETESATSQEIRLHISSSETTPPSDIASHAGFKIVGDEIFASNGDGATQKITTTGENIPGGDFLTRLKVEILRGVSCKFYVDGVLKVTHTDNIPTGLANHIHVAIRTKTSAYRTFGAGRVLLQRAP